MGKKGMTKYNEKFKVGDRYGEWIVLNEEIIIEKEAKVLCKCCQCNQTQRYVPAFQLVAGVSKRCSKCGYSNKRCENPSWKGYKEIPFSWFSKYFLRANKKRMGNITIENVYDLWIKQNKKCNLSGGYIDFEKRDGEITASIDRIDSKKEYVLDNVQLVHKNVNLMKNSFEQDYFIQMCEKIANERKNKDR